MATKHRKQYIFTISSGLGAGISGSGELDLSHKCGTIWGVSVACSSTNFDFLLGTKSGFAESDLSQRFIKEGANKWFSESSERPIFFHNTDTTQTNILYFRLHENASVATGKITIILTVDLDTVILVTGTTTVTADA